MVNTRLGEWLKRVAGLLYADAVLLAAWDARRDICTPLSSWGYSAESVAALSVDYPRLYSVPVLTEMYGGIDPLVYTIGAQPPSRLPFRQSPIYREALFFQGFQDGLTIQVRRGTEHVGYAHFSSILANVYDDRLQRHGQALSSVLSEPIVDSFSSTGRGHLIVDRNGAVERTPGDLPIREDDTCLQAVARAFLQETSAHLICFLWAEGRSFVRVTFEKQERASTVRISAIPASAPYGLTPTELRILTAMVVHATNEEIAAAIGTGVRTVHTHVANALRKLDCKNRTQAVVLALRERLLMPDPKMLVALADWALN